MQQQTVETETEAARVRVTPQEFVLATAAIEARDAARAQHEAATIPIGEAVQQLNLSATPHEVLAEVLAQRTPPQQAGVTQKRAPRSRAVKILSGVIAAQFVVIGLLWIRVLDSSARISGLQWQGQSSFVPAPVPAPQTTNANNVRQMNPTLFQSLALKEGQSAHCSLDQIKALARGANPATMWAAKQAAPLTWQLTRKAGKLGVRCWITPDDATKLANGQPAIVEPDSSVAEGATALTIPIETFTNAQTIMANGDVPVNVQVK